MTGTISAADRQMVKNNLLHAVVAPAAAPIDENLIAAFPGDGVPASATQIVSSTDPLPSQEALPPVRVEDGIVGRALDADAFTPTKQSAISVGSFVGPLLPSRTTDSASKSGQPVSPISMSKFAPSNWIVADLLAAAKRNADLAEFRPHIQRADAMHHPDALDRFVKTLLSSREFEGV